MIYIKISMLTKDGQKCGGYVDEINKIDIPALFDGAFEGDRYVFEAVEMEPKEFSQLEEFMGF